MSCFILVDDDPQCHLLAELALHATLPDAEVIAFLEAEKSLTYICQNYMQQQEPYIVLLDLNMPGMNGWTFLEELENIPWQALERLRIFILSSSIDERDQSRAESNPLVSGYIEKPLTCVKIRSILEMAKIGSAKSNS